MDTDSCTSNDYSTDNDFSSYASANNSNDVCQADVDDFESVMNGNNAPSDMCFGNSQSGYDFENEMCVGPSYSGVDDLMAYGFDPSEQESIDFSRAVMPAVIDLLLANRRTNIRSPVKTEIEAIDPAQAAMRAVIGLLLDNKPTVRNADPTKTNQLEPLHNGLDICGRRTNLTLEEYEVEHPFEYQTAVSFIGGLQGLSRSVMYDEANMEFADYLHGRVNQAYSDGWTDIAFGLHDILGIAGNLTAGTPEAPRGYAAAGAARAAYGDITTAQTAGEFAETLPGLLESAWCQNFDGSLDPAITEELWGDLIDQIRSEWDSE